MLLASSILPCSDVCHDSGVNRGHSGPCSAPTKEGWASTDLERCCRAMEVLATLTRVKKLLEKEEALHRVFWQNQSGKKKACHTSQCLGRESSTHALENFGFVFWVPVFRATC